MASARKPPRRRCSGATCRGKPPWVLPAMAPLHPTFTALPSFNRIEALLRCCIAGYLRGAALTYPAIGHRPVSACQLVGLASRRQSGASDAAVWVAAEQRLRCGRRTLLFCERETLLFCERTLLSSASGVIKCSTREPACCRPPDRQSDHRATGHRAAYLPGQTLTVQGSPGCACCRWRRGL